MAKKRSIAAAIAALTCSGVALAAPAFALDPLDPADARSGERQATSQTAAAATAEDDETPKSTGGEVLKTGWWWVANQPPAETGLAAFPQPPSPNIPPGSLPVAAAAGEADKISAIELKLAAKPGAMVQSAKVVLTESTSPGANGNAEAAKIIACPVTDGFWADGAAARWDAKPAFDCQTAQAAGTRDDKGRWTFDLTAIATSWLTPGTTASHSFVLVEAVDAPESFQVTFAPVSEGGVVYTGKYGPASSSTGGLFGGSTTSSSGGTTSSGISGSTSSGSLSGGTSGGSLSSSGSLDAGTGSLEGAAPADTGATAETTEPVAAGDTALVSAPAVIKPWYSGLPKGSILLLPFALALAYLAMLALGPDAQPTASTTRHGVSRALDRLREAGTTALAGVRR